MSKAVHIDLSNKDWSNPRNQPDEEGEFEPTKDEVRGKRDHKHNERDKGKKDKKFEEGYWN